jgi:ethanolamine utilization protein EutQ (cupin superfamily)
MIVAKPRIFHASSMDWQNFPGTTIKLASAITKDEARPWSCYFARFGKGERAPLPASYDEIWILSRGRLRLLSGQDTWMATTGDLIEVPVETAGEVIAEEDSELVCISVPPH